MGAFWGGLAWFLGVFLGPLIFRAFWALGIGYVTYQGLMELIEPVLQEVEQNVQSLGGFGPYAAYAMQELRVLPSISLILGAVQVSLLIRVTKAGTRRINKGGGD